MDPSQSEKVILVLNTEQFFNILHVAVVWPCRLLWHNYVGNSKLIMCLKDNQQKEQQTHDRRNKQTCSVLCYKNKQLLPYTLSPTLVHTHTHTLSSQFKII